MKSLSVVGLVLVVLCAGATLAGPVRFCDGDGWGPAAGKLPMEEGPRFGGPLAGFPHGNLPDGGFPHDGFPHDGFPNGGGWFGSRHLGWFGTGEHWQDRFETRLDGFQTAYEEAAEDPDFYSSELYDDMVKRLQRLVDGYDRFVSFEELAIDRVDGSIDKINDRIDRLNEVLDKIADGEKVPDRWYEKFEDRIAQKIEWLTERIDWLTEKKDTLTVNLDEYIAFQTDLLAYLDEVLNAGNPPSETAAAFDWPSEGDAAWSSDGDAAWSFADDAGSAEPMMAAAPEVGEGAAAVPEPVSLLLIAQAVILVLTRRSRSVVR
ncbi:MAG TPA: hypothetical protein DD670_10955 [Planctomycetaceae bacterium]|nr:hypothetical protein [Planctomycetaceae bacterium]